MLTFCVVLDVNARGATMSPLAMVYLAIHVLIPSNTRGRITNELIDKITAGEVKPNESVRDHPKYRLSTDI